jgi:hypothetical protein
MMRERIASAGLWMLVAGLLAGQPVAQGLPPGICVPDALGVVIACPPSLKAAQAEHRPPIPQQGQAVQGRPERGAGEDQEPRHGPGWPATIEDAEQTSRAECGTSEECRSEQRDYSDLRAQWRAADAAQGQQSLALAQTVIAIVATVIAGLGTFFVVSTLKEARRSADAAVTAAKAANDANELNRQAFLADQRPWIAEDAAVGAPVRWSTNGCTITLGFSLENTGRTPAMHVRVRMKIFSMLRQDIIKEQMALSDSAKNDNPSYGLIIFPGRTRNQLYSLTINIKQIQEANKIWAEEQPEEEFICPHIIGCVQYYTLSGVEHQTGFFYNLVKSDGSMIMRRDGDLSPEEVRLQRSFMVGRTY